MHWTKDPANKSKLARAAAKRARTRKKRGRSIAKSVEAVRYGSKPNVIGVIRDELRQAQKRVTALKAILRKYQSVQ